MVMTRETSSPTFSSCRSMEDSLSPRSGTGSGSQKQQPQQQWTQSTSGCGHTANKDASASEISTGIRSVSPGDDLHDASSALCSSLDLPLSPKPFFIMDWLEQVNSNDLELAQQMLQTPQKVLRQQGDEKNTATSAGSRMLPSSSRGETTIHSPKLLFESSTNVASTATATPTADTSATPPQLSSPQTLNSCFRKRSVALGNRYNAKGLAKAKVNKWQDARLCWETALEIRSQVLGEFHLDVAHTANNLGIALGRLGSYDAAISMLQRALAIRTQHLGREHDQVAATLHNIGNVLQQAGDWNHAVVCFCESKRLLENLLGPDHVQVARAGVSVGNTYYQAMEYREAHAAYWDALSIFERAGLPKDNVEVQTILTQLHQLNCFMSQT